MKASEFNMAFSKGYIARAANRANSARGAQVARGETAWITVQSVAGTLTAKQQIALHRLLATARLVAHIETHKDGGYFVTTVTAYLPLPEFKKRSSIDYRAAGEFWTGRAINTIEHDAELGQVYHGIASQNYRMAAFFDR